MGQMLGNLKNAGNIQEADTGDLSTGEKMQRGLFGGLSGGIKGMGQQMGQGGAAPSAVGIGPAPQVDFSQIGQPKRNPFYGGY